MTTTRHPTVRCLFCNRELFGSSALYCGPVCEAASRETFEPLVAAAMTGASLDPADDARVRLWMARPNAASAGGEA
jgi:hypothetical protein